ncbi:MAG TPA: ThuA domain-containing protein [Deinococcales bacterium]|nr:ThuA domain-containing protein [Deinococcales bacterium]
MKRALILAGGWPGHQPKETSELFAGALEEKGFGVQVAGSLDVLLDPEAMRDLSLIVPNWTMGSIGEEAEKALRDAVRGGVGLGGWHGGMGDAFRNSPAFQFMVGGQFVAHPGNKIAYRVNVSDREHEITRGLSDFDFTSEQYYLHVDPSNRVLATTTFGGEHVPHIAGTVMPVAWTRQWWEGRVYYCSLGHDTSDFQASPQAFQLVLRGLLWAAR